MRGPAGGNGRIYAIPEPSHEMGECRVGGLEFAEREAGGDHTVGEEGVLYLRCSVYEGQQTDGIDIDSRWETKSGGGCGEWGGGEKVRSRKVLGKR